MGKSRGELLEPDPIKKMIMNDVMYDILIPKFVELAIVV